MGGDRFSLWGSTVCSTRLNATPSPLQPGPEAGRMHPLSSFPSNIVNKSFFSFPLIDVQGPPLKYLYQNLCLSLALKWNTNCESGNQPQVAPLMYQNSCWMSGLDKTTSYPILQSYLIKQKQSVAFQQKRENSHLESTQSGARVFGQTSNLFSWFLIIPH